MRGSNAGDGGGRKGGEERSGRNENMKWSREIREYKETDKKTERRSGRGVGRGNASSSAWE